MFSVGKIARTPEHQKRNFNSSPTHRQASTTTSPTYHKYITKTWLTYYISNSSQTQKKYTTRTSPTSPQTSSECHQHIVNPLRHNFEKTKKHEIFRKFQKSKLFKNPIFYFAFCMRSTIHMFRLFLIFGFLKIGIFQNPKFSKTQFFI